MNNLNKKEQIKYEIIEKILKNEISKPEASKKLNISVRQINRLIIKDKSEGKEGFIHKNKGKMSNKKISDKESDKIWFYNK